MKKTYCDCCEKEINHEFRKYGIVPFEKLGDVRVNLGFAKWTGAGFHSERHFDLCFVCTSEVLRAFADQLEKADLLDSDLNLWRYGIRLKRQYNF